MNEIAGGIGEDVALASLGLLARVVAARSAAFRGFHALAVDHAGTRTCLAACRFASDQQQRMVERQPPPVVQPQVEPAPHRRDRRAAERQERKSAGQGKRGAVSVELGGSGSCKKKTKQ